MIEDKVKMFDTPVLFLIFNRPEVTQLVFNQIRDVKPKQLFVAADGPRNNKQGEVEKCEITRKIIEQIDWDCELYTLFQEENLGCGKAVSSAITWFFENVEEGIILEDDCLPNVSFFLFCDKLLKKYRDDKTIMMISGTNFNIKWKANKQSYHFSYLGGIWGWATWKRSWDLYDYDMKAWDLPETKSLIKKLLSKLAISYRFELFDQVKHKKIDTWDYQWSFCRLINYGFSIVPSVNLISNIGFGTGATHTINSDNTTNLKTYELCFPMFHSEVIWDKKYDRILAKKLKNFNLLIFVKVKLKLTLIYIKHFLENIINKPNNNTLW